MNNSEEDFEAIDFNKCILSDMKRRRRNAAGMLENIETNELE